MADTNDRGETFGEWLLAQKGRDDRIADLVAGAKADSKFPRRGSPNDVRKHLYVLQADRGWFEVIDDAETDWLSY